LVWVRPSRLARRLYFHLFVIGSGRIREPREFGPFEKPGAGLSWVESGHGHLRLGGRQWELKPSQFILYSAGQPRVLASADGKILTTRLLWFGGPGLEAWMEELDAAHQPVFQMQRAAKIHRLHDQLLQLVKLRPARWEWNVHLKLVVVLQELLLARHRSSHDDRLMPNEITRALNAIEAEPARDWRPNELAAQAGMSYSAFRALFRQHMRETPHAFIQRTRLDLARELLADERLRIKEIAQRLHFSHDHYFSSFFRSKTGVTPSEFRKHLGIESGQFSE
jgi:AraC-like DNA-binding protein